MSSTVRTRDVSDVPAGSEATHNLNGTSPAEKTTGRDLSDPSLYNNRELSLLEYHQRALGEADDSSNPLLERLKLPCIVAANPDQFFEVRVAALIYQPLSHLRVSGSDGIRLTDELA